MFTSMDKALAALLGVIVYFLGQFGINLPWLTPELTSDIAVAVTPFVVWLVPNKPRATSPS